MTICELLKASHLFKEFDSKEIEWIESISKRNFYSAGQKIFSEGDEATKMKLVASGTVSILREASGQEIIKIGKGETFGEMPFLDGGMRSATAMACGETELIEISYNKLSNLLINHPDMALKFYIVFAKFVSKRLRSTMQF